MQQLLSSQRQHSSMGMTPPIFVVYGQVVSILIIGPLALYNWRRNSCGWCLGLKTSALIFAASFFGTTDNQNMYFQGLYLSSAAVATPVVNLVPVVIFVMAIATRQEKIDFGGMRSMTKVLGTVVCVSEAVSIALLKGPKLLNSGEYMRMTMSSMGLQIHDWVLGCLLLLGSSCCWLSWLILQSAAWTCFLGMIQSAILALFLERQLEDWRMKTTLDFGACLLSGVGAVVSFFGQACLSGAGAIIVGLYMVLWGKAKDCDEDAANIRQGALAGISACEDVPVRSNDHHQDFADGSSEKAQQKVARSADLQEPLLEP